MKKFTALMLVPFILLGCKPAAQPALPPLKDAQAALAWVEQTKTTAIQSAQRSAQSQTELLLNVPLLPSEKNVFITADLAADTAQKPAPDSQPSAARPPLEQFWDRQKINLEPAAPIAQTLNDAQTSDIVFSGTLVRGARTQALVKVNQHVYIVNVGDVIGKGAWRVLTITPQSMQLQIGKKAISYAKN